MTPEEHQILLDEVDAAGKDPKVDPKLLAQVRAEVMKRRPAPPTTQERPSVLAPELGAQGIDMLESKLGTPEANEAQAQAEQAGMALPRGARTQAGPEDIAKNEAAAKARLAEVYDPNLPSASHIKALHRPPEFYPPHPHTGLLDIPGGMRMMMPTYAGGETTHFAEPTVEQFRRDMGPVIGSRIATMDTNTAEYRQYADLLWQRVYDQAKAAGKPVVRHEFASKSDAWDRLAYHVGDAVDALGGAVNGVGRDASFGGINAAAGKLGGDQAALDLASAEERNPTASAVGGFVGAMQNPALRGLGWLGEMIGGKPTSIVGSALKSSIEGAAGGAVAAGGEDAVDALASGQPMDMESTKDRMVSGIKSGGLAGLGFDLLGQAGGTVSRALRQDRSLGPSTRAVEDAGGTIGGWRGVRPSKDMKGALDAAGEKGARAHVAEQIMGPAADKGFEQIAAAKRRAELINDAYRLANEEQYAEHGPFVEELQNRRQRLEGPNGPIRPDAARVYDDLLSTLPPKDQAIKPRLSAAMRAEAHEPSVPSEADALTGPRTVPDAKGGMSIDNIHLDRSGLRAESLAAAHAAHAAGTAAPPEIAVFPGQKPFVQDGRHRILAAQERGMESLPIKVRRYDDAGNTLSLTHEPLNLRAASDTQVSPPPRTGTLEPRQGGMTLEQARAAGHDPAALLEDAGIPESIAKDFEFFIDNPSKGMNPRHVDLIIDRIDNLLKEGQGGKPDPEYAWLASAARKMRDSLPDDPDILGNRSGSYRDPDTGKPVPLRPGSWSGFKANVSEEAARAHQALGLAGVEGAEGIPDANRLKQARGAFANAGDPARPAENRVQRALAEAAGVSGGYKTIVGLRGREELLARSALPLEGGGMGGRGQRAVNRARLSLDPALRNMDMNPNTSSTPYRGLKLRTGLRGGAAGQGAAEALRKPNVNFVGPDGNGRDISDQEAGRIKSGVDYYRLMGLF